jgi:predicted RecB family nuclease
MITDQTFISFLNCRRKAFLQAAGNRGEQADIERVQLDLDALYRRKTLEEYLAPYPPSDVLLDPGSWAAVSGRPRVVVNVTVTGGDLQSHLHAVEQVEGRVPATYTPILFVRNNRLTRFDKLLLAFQALTLGFGQGAVPSVAKLIYGDSAKTLKVKVDPLLGEVRRIVEAIRVVQSEPSPPRVTLNGHCSACEFRLPCRQSAEMSEDLSLLRGMPLKEIEKQRARGITTVTHFSHTYRPGRRGKRRSGKARRHDYALQALAIREKKVYVLDSPTIVHTGTALYLDVESVPDRNFYYLIGLVAAVDGGSTTYSFWADDASQQKANWDRCVQIIEGFGEYTLYHYGSFESRFLDQMKQSADSDDKAAVDRIRARSCNVLAGIYSHVYFPTYTNGLKDIAALLGASWSAANASGIQSIAWRLAWETRRQESFKQELLRYNQEDCLALRRVTEFLLSVSEGAAGQTTGGRVAIAQAENLEPAKGFRFGKPQFFCSDLAHISKCAYSDYQREKVYTRTSPAVRQSLRRRQRAERRQLPVNEEVECKRPEICPECGAKQVHTFHARSSHKIVWDLRFTSSGVKRWVVRYTAKRYRCWQCMSTFLPGTYRDVDRRGHNLTSWAIYQHVALAQSHAAVILGLNEIFGLSFNDSFLCRLRPRIAEKYRPAVELLKDKLRRGPLIHADETKVQVQTGCGYVWAFTNLEEVIYVYTPTREGTILEEMLNGFTGVLVSDFYTAYDTAKCPQQKCLIHLARDINDDLFHSPFDEELKQLAHELVAILKPIIDTIDRFGLKRHHLHKHQEEVTRFYRRLAEQIYQSEIAQKYQKRLLKYRAKLFVFLDHDGIPWNNNNAENALKRFASRRKIIGASFGRQGLQDYLVFLSLYQTCRSKHVSFLKFLRSGELNVNVFAAAGG